MISKTKPGGRKVTWDLKISQLYCFDFTTYSAPSGQKEKWKYIWEIQEAAFRSRCLQWHKMNDETVDSELCTWFVWTGHLGKKKECPVPTWMFECSLLACYGAPLQRLCPCGRLPGFHMCTESCPSTRSCLIKTR